MIRKYIDNNKLTAAALFALSLCPLTNLAHAEVEINNGIVEVAGIEGETAIYTAPSDISLYQLALQSGITVDALRKLNHGQVDNIEILAAAQSIVLPKTSPLFSQTQQEEVSAITALPELSTRELGNETATELLINTTPAGRYVTGTAEENTANIAQSVATQDWSNLTPEIVLDDAETWAKNQAKQALMEPIEKGANELLGRFGKGSVNISIDEDGSLRSSSLSLLSPWYDDKESLFFSQVGINSQNRERTIGNFGFGYRYEQDSYLLGTNAFIDHDFTGSNTRLGLGTELWMDNLKLAANYYTPLSDWKESDVLLDFEERPAQGFDIRAQAYLPNYEQLGASLKYEQYFGDQVGLFGENKEALQHDPKAISIGLDYTPIPLVTFKAAQRFGDDGEKDTRLDMNLNLQLGTPLEKQLDPDNVAATRSLKGSRYDLVDRNYDIVFEYRQNIFQVMWNLPTPYSMEMGETLPLQVLTTSKTPIVKVVWSIKTKLGRDVTTGFDPQDLSNNDLKLNFKPDDLDNYIIIATVTNQAGMTVSTIPFELNMRMGTGGLARTRLKFIDTETRATSVSAIPSGQFGDYTSDEILQLSVKAVQFDEAGIEKMLKFTDGQWWIRVMSPDGTEEFINTINGNFGNESTLLLVKQDLISDENGIEINGIEYGIVSAINFANVPVKIQIGYSVIEGEKVDPIFHDGYFNRFYTLGSVSFQLFERGIDGKQPRTTAMTPNDNLKIDTYYEVVILDQDNNEVTGQFVDTIRWHYVDGANNQVDLEGCMGYAMFSTQRTNFDNNEFSWGNLVRHPLETEQGLRLMPSIDLSNWNPDGVLDENTNVYCENSGAAVEAVEEYNGYQFLNGQG
ncbi:inverse autotransporter beta domain-containing protein [Thorsellia anophelis]|uniref:Invasin beta-domain of outer membrane n=1 Tax=Thorsellia anophelis DSM 18579 TaxID=1123402 RepID=A0A1H9YGN5_9GAMM|nr:inverse autotransporter beta domain-containing protein [Thorsellia anophelis]SES67738.1 Invasin beta-domain of outer membrane [Thorsellia anophelis DSM 18579]